MGLLHMTKPIHQDWRAQVQPSRATTRHFTVCHTHTHSHTQTYTHGPTWATRPCSREGSSARYAHTHTHARSHTTHAISRAHTHRHNAHTHTHGPTWTAWPCSREGSSVVLAWLSLTWCLYQTHTLRHIHTHTTVIIPATITLPWYGLCKQQIVDENKKRWILINLDCNKKR